MGPQLDEATCHLRVSTDRSSADLVVSLGGPYGGGKLVDLTQDFSGEIEPQDDLAAGYTLSNWIAGVTSGALYSFRALGLPRRRVRLHRLEGVLPVGGMQALANASSVAVANLCARDAPALSLDGWKLEVRPRSGEDSLHDTHPELSRIEAKPVAPADRP